MRDFWLVVLCFGFPSSVKVLEVIPSNFQPHSENLMVWCSGLSWNPGLSLGPRGAGPLGIGAAPSSVAETT